jgi:hypothetical protein
VEKCCTAGQATDDNMAHAHCMLDTYGYRHPLRIRNTFCICSATMVARTYLICYVIVHCLSCLLQRSSKGINLTSLRNLNSFGSSLLTLNTQDFGFYGGEIHVVHRAIRRRLAAFQKYVLSPTLRMSQRNVCYHVPDHTASHNIPHYELSKQF